MGWAQKLERLLRNAGVMLVVLYLLAMIHRSVLSHAELHKFKLRQTALAADVDRLPPSTAIPSVTLWSVQRVRDFQDGLNAHFASAIGILRIARIDIEAPIVEGTDALSLNRGVGHIAGTANPGGDGNVAIAGHRDGFFRRLKDIRLGDAIEVAGMHKTERYIVDRIMVVGPTDIWVLHPRAHSTLTLVTCYPFHYVGSAPKRYIVQASAIDPIFPDLRVRAESGSRATSVGLPPFGR